MQKYGDAFSKSSSILEKSRCGVVNKSLARGQRSIPSLTELMTKLIGVFSHAQIKKILSDRVQI